MHTSDFVCQEPPDDFPELFSCPYQTVSPIVSGTETAITA